MNSLGETEMIPDPLTEEELLDLNELLLDTREQGQLMQELIDSQIRKKDELIDRLHQELEYYKQDQAGRLVEQVMKELIGLLGRMQKKLNSPQWPQMDGEALRQEFTYLEEDILDLLERQNIEPFSTLPGERFEGGRHRAMAVEPAAEKQLDHTVKASLSPGYAKGEKVLLPERVIVYRFQ